MAKTTLCYQVVPVLQVQDTELCIFIISFRVNENKQWQSSPELNIKKQITNYDSNHNLSLSIGPLLVLPELESLIRTAMTVVGKERRAVVSVTTREIKIGLVLGVAESEYHVRTNDILCPMMECLPDLSVVSDVVDCRALEIPLSREVRSVMVSLASNILSVSYRYRKQLALYSG